LATAALAVVASLAWPAARGAAAEPAAGDVDPTQYLQDNFSVRATVPGARFRVEKEGLMQVELYSTLPVGLSDVKLKVDSDQFEATAAPSPSWRTCPELPAGAADGAKGRFDVSLRRKAGSVDDAPDLSLRVYASCRGKRFLAAALTLAEALDEHQVPFNPALKIDGQPPPQFWGNALVLKDFMASQRHDDYLVGYKYARAGSTNQTRVYLAADNDNLYFLVATIGYAWLSPSTQLKVLMARTREEKPVVLAVDELTFQLTCTPAVEGAKCVRCAPAPAMNTGGCDAVIYQVGVPRKPARLEMDTLYMNFSRIVPPREGKGSEAIVPGVRRTGPEVLCWRGNQRSAEDPAVFGKMVLQKQKGGK
jgi:hypothetical protein